MTDDVAEFVRLTAAERREAIEVLDVLLDAIDAGEIEVEPTERAYLAGVLHGLRTTLRR